MTEGNDDGMKIEALLKLTDWTMTEPVDGSSFHLIVAVVGILLAIITAVAFAGKQRLAASRIDLIVGLILLLSEIYKQLFRYFIVDGRHYCVEFVPFQLCSLPMYLCLINALLMHRHTKWESRQDKYIKDEWISKQKIICAINTFIIDFNLMGALMVFVDPSGIFSGIC